MNNAILQGAGQDSGGVRRRARARVGRGVAQQAGAPFTIQIDGSSTVFPISEAVAEGFQQTTQGRIRVAVGESGSSAGLRKFCRGEIHIADSSRPIRSQRNGDLRRRRHPIC